jgi:hypothetical protein
MKTAKTVGYDMSGKFPPGIDILNSKSKILKEANYQAFN